MVIESNANDWSMFNKLGPECTGEMAVSPSEENQRLSAAAILYFDRYGNGAFQQQGAGDGGKRYS